MRGRFRYRFVIEEVYTPETLPMSRLAEYMAKVAALLGERSQVHFVGMEGGSAVLVQEVEQEAHAKVRERLHAVHRDDGPQDATLAYDALNGLLTADRASGALFEGDGRDAGGTRVLRFPGAADDGHRAVRHGGGHRGGGFDTHGAISRRQEIRSHPVRGSASRWIGRSWQWPGNAA